MRTWQQKLVTALGAVYVLVGLVGFSLTSGVEFAGREGRHLFGIFEVNPLHNLVHLALGAALLWAGLTGGRVLRTVGTALGTVLVLLAIAGPMIAETDANIIALNSTDHLLHAATGLVTLLASLSEPARAGVRSGSRASAMSR